MTDRPRIVLIAGPNGAGKTTFAKEFLPREAATKHFINADLISLGLSPFHPELAAVKATKLMAESIDELVGMRESFALETSLAGLRYSKHIPVWRALGFRVELYFLSLSSPELAVARVATRSGPAITDEVVWRRYAAGLDHFERIYKSQVDVWWRFDTSPGIPIVEAGRPETSAVDAARRAFDRALHVARQSRQTLAIAHNGAVQRLAPDDPYFNQSS